MTTFERSVDLPVDCEQAFRWHERPGALDRLIPPWERVQIERRGNGLAAGTEVWLRNRIGPLSLRWIAEHTACEPPRMFRDVQRSGPFKKWTHTHAFDDRGGQCRLTDRVEYQLPGGPLGKLLAGRMISRKVNRMFEYRHSTTTADLATHSRYQADRLMHVAVSGSSGLVGSTLIPLLTTGGHSVSRLVRRDTDQDDEVRWDPAAQVFDAQRLDGVDAVVHLAGESIANSRWNDRVKEKIRSSRVEGTRLLCEGLAAMAQPPKVLVCASAIGFYGDRGDELLDESSTAGETFLASVAQEWEEATAPAAAAGIRVVNLRLGVVLSTRDGALSKLLLPFKLGAGGKVGSGRQYWSWIGVDDVAGVILHCLMTESLHGPVNAVAPQAVTNLEFTKTLGRVLRRPTLFPLPAFAARLGLGEMADELLLASTRVAPAALQQSGYTFRHAELEPALRHLLGK